MTHLDHNPFKPSGIFPDITYLEPLQLEYIYIYIYIFEGKNIDKTQIKYI